MNEQHPSETSEPTYRAPETTYTPTHAALSPTAHGPGAYGPPVPGAYPQVSVAPKNPAIALLASFFIPGLGTLMNGETGKGLGILIGYFVAFLMSFVIIGIPFAIGLWIWGMVDAHSGAKKWNVRHGIIS